jgi:hypothetical protein
VFHQSGNWLVPAYYVVTLVVMSALRAAYGLFRTFDPRFLLFLLYGFLHVLALVPVRFKSILTLTDNGWGTRASRGKNAYFDLATWVCGYACCLLAVYGVLDLLSPAQIGDLDVTPRTITGLIREWPSRLAYSVAYAAALASLLVIVPRAFGRAGRRRGVNARMQAASSVIVPSIEAKCRGDATVEVGG